MSRLYKYLVFITLFVLLAVVFVVANHHSTKQAVLTKSTGDDYKRMGQQESKISDLVGKRMLAEAARCDSEGVSKQERARRVHAIYLAGMAEIKRVRDSSYKLPFDKTVLETANLKTP